jgi:hypothetical protein
MTHDPRFDSHTGHFAAGLFSAGFAVWALHKTGASQQRDADNNGTQQGGELEGTVQHTTPHINTHTPITSLHNGWRHCGYQKEARYRR